MTLYRHGRRPLHEHLRHHATKTPDKAAIVWYGRRISYAELDDASERFARCLQNRGLGAGDVVVVCLQNCPQAVIAHLGAQKLGAIVSPCNPHARAWEIGHQVRQVQAAALLVGDEILGSVAAAGLPDRGCLLFVTASGDLLPKVIAIDVPNSVRLRDEPAPPRPAGAIDFLDALAAAAPFTAAPSVGLDDIALMLCTSGSSGLPKAAMLSHESVVYKSAAAADGFGLDADSVLLADVALSHVSGLLTGLALPIYLGATVVLLQRFDALAVLQAIDAFRVSWWYTMAPSLPAVMDCDGAIDFDLSSLGWMAATSFGVPLTERLAARWCGFSGGGRVYEAGYGLSETHSCDTIMPRDAVRWGSNGKPAPGVEIRIVDVDTGRDLSPGRRGEILLRSPVRFRGYWGQPGASAEAVVGGWVRTGDIGVVDVDGYLSFVGRRKEIIKVWSESVYPEEVEAILATHPDVSRVAVVGCPEPDRGEVLNAYVVLTAEAAVRREAGRGSPGAVERRLLRWCDDHMAHYKVPRSIILRHALPMAGCGKLLRRALRDAAVSGHCQGRPKGSFAAIAVSRPRALNVAGREAPGQDHHRIGTRTQAPGHKPRER